MNPRTLVTLLAVFCSLAACKKNGSANSPNPDNGKAKLYIAEYHTASNPTITDTFHLTYDNNARLISAISPGLNWTFSHPADSSLVSDFVSPGQPSIHQVNYMKNGLIDSIFRTQDVVDTMVGQFDYIGRVLNKMTVSFLYQGIRSVFISVAYTYDNNGNVTKTVQTDGQNSYQYINEYTYTDKAAPLPVLFPALIPVQSKNLPATQVVTNVTSNGSAPSVTVSISYVYDTSSRLIKETDTQDANTYTIKTWVY